MTDIAPLSTGVIERIMRGEEVDKPVLQIVGTKIIKDGEKDRLRLFVSDGKCINSYCMLATQLNQLHVEGKLSEYTIVRVDKYITSAVNDNVARKRVLIIVELSVLKPGNEVGKKIGTPVSYTEEDAAQSNKASSSDNGTVPKPTAASNAKKAEPHPSPYNNNNKENTSLKNDYEMTLTGLTEIKPCEEDDNDIPEIKYDLVPISQLPNLEARTSVDTIGICKEVGKLHTFPSGKKRRELTLVDSSNAAVILKLWDDDAVNFDVHAQHQVILVEGARVAVFKGNKEINKGNGSVMKINPDTYPGRA